MQWFLIFCGHLFLGRAKCYYIPWCSASIKSSRFIISIAICPRANGLKQMGKNCWFAHSWISKFSSTAVFRRLCGQTGTLASYHLPLLSHHQGCRTAHIQISLTCRDSTSNTTTNRNHRDRQVKTVNQTHIIVMQLIL